MKIGPKYKICKRLGASIFEKCQTKAYQIAEARAPRKQGKRSDYGSQLIEKQKARLSYGLSERQFHRYAQEAMEEHGSNSAAALLSRLEARLDSVVYRAGFAPTRRAARQIVSHGHITVNGRRMMVPSFKVEEGMTVAIRTESRTSPFFANRTEKMADFRTPAWMEIGDSGFSTRVVSQPTVASQDVQFDPAVIIQFYSR